MKFRCFDAEIAVEVVGIRNKEKEIFRGTKTKDYFYTVLFTLLESLATRK